MKKLGLNVYSAHYSDNRKVIFLGRVFNKIIKGNISKSDMRRASINKEVQKIESCGSVSG